MKNRKIKYLFISLLMLGAVMAIATGCDKRTKYKVLSFFFTGVPSPDGEKKAETNINKEEATMAPKKVEKPPPEVKFFTHGPYASDQCEQCHGPGAFPGSRGKTAGFSLRGAGVPGGFVKPSKFVCLECHTTKSARNAYSRGLWIHGPAAAGDCIICHSPHKSANPFMLLKSPTDTCTQCHSEGYIMNRAAHKEAENCLSCHNPHLGKNSFMLKNAYDEIY